MKKISLMLICGVMLFGLCGCNNEKNIKDINGNELKEFIGTWEIDGVKDVTLSDQKVYNLNNFIIKEMVSTNDCMGVGCLENSFYYYYVDNKLYSNIASIEVNGVQKFLCVQLEDKETLKQVSCDILKDEMFAYEEGMTEPNSLENFGITYKKKSNDIDESLTNTNIFELSNDKTQLNYNKIIEKQNIAKSLCKNYGMEASESTGCSVVLDNSIIQIDTNGIIIRMLNSGECCDYYLNFKEISCFDKNANVVPSEFLSNEFKNVQSKWVPILHNYMDEVKNKTGYTLSELGYTLSELNY